MTKSTTRIKADVAGIAGRKNLIINGGFDVWQRGNYTSAVATSNAAYSADRWKTWLGAVSATIENTVVSINGKTKNAFKIEATSSATGYIGLLQIIDGENVPKNEDAIVSAWVRTNNVNTRFRENWFSGADSNSPALNPDGNWHKVTWNINNKQTPSSGNVAIGIITYNTAAVPVSSGDYIEVADFQLEIGSVATDFEHRSYGEELALCQRYYQKVGNGSAYTTFGIFNAETTGSATCAYVYPQEMRGPPTVNKGGTWQFFTGGITSTLNTFNGLNTTKTTCRIEAAPFAALTVGISHILRCENDANAFIDFDAEL